MIKFSSKNKLISIILLNLFFFNFFIVKAQPSVHPNVYIKVNTINENSIVFTFFNNTNENLVYIYEIDIIDVKKNEVVKEFYVYTKLFLKENNLDTLIFKVNELKEKNQYIIKVTSKKCLNGIKIKPVEIKFKTL